MGPREGWVPSLPLSPHLSLTSPPPLPGFSEVPTLKKDASKPKISSPLHAPAPAAWALGTEPPISPTIALDVAAGEGWAQGPAGSGHSVVLSLRSQRILCQLPDLTQYFLQPTFQSGWASIPNSAQKLSTAFPGLPTQVSGPKLSS